MHVASPSNQIKVLNHVNANAVTGAPKFMLLGAKPVFVLNNSDAATTNAYVIEALIRGAPKTTGEAWAINAALYWDNTAAKWTTTSSGNTLGAYAAAIAGSGDTTGDIHLISLNP
jgi:predicted RecA/RadA family phage recombinase